MAASGLLGTENGEIGDTKSSKDILWECVRALGEYFVQEDISTKKRVDIALDILDGIIKVSEK